MGLDWRQLKSTLAAEIAEGRLLEGDRVPNEVEIAATYGIGRHSVRRAMAALAADGLLSVEQGRGTFVRRRPRILYRIGRRTRFAQNLSSQGLTPGGETIATEIVSAPQSVADALGLGAGAPVHRALRRGRADGAAILLGLSYHDARRFPDWPQRHAAIQSVTQTYRTFGIDDYRRRNTELYARLPEDWEARLLEQKADQPVMVQCKTDAATDGQPIGHSESIWCAGRVRFSLESEATDD